MFEDETAEKEKRVLLGWRCQLCSPAEEKIPSRSEDGLSSDVSERGYGNSPRCRSL
jgi:hypothetical protein